MAVAVCGIVGDSGAGKTQLVVQLVPVLAAYGLRVGYVKHAAHGFDLDRPESDSWRVNQAGASEVVLSGPAGTVRFDAREPGVDPDLHDIVPSQGGCDVILVEGFSGGDQPKIRVTGPHGSPPRDVAPPVLLDLTRHAERWDDEDVHHAAEIVCGLLVDGPGPRVTVVADGVDVSVAGFAARAVAAGVLGITSALRGVDAPVTLTVTVEAAPRSPSTNGSRLGTAVRRE